jgi:glycerol transport system ATP-binding protein
VSGGKVILAGQLVETVRAELPEDGRGKLEIGIRPEFVGFAAAGIPVDVVKVADAGRYRIVDTRHACGAIKMLVPEDTAVPEGRAYVRFDPAQTRVYRDGWVLS